MKEKQDNQFYPPFEEPWRHDLKRLENRILAIISFVTAVFVAIYVLFS